MLFLPIKNFNEGNLGATKRLLETSFQVTTLTDSGLSVVT